MQVFINNREIEIFRGARVIDAILQYSKHAHNLVKIGQTLVFDRFGNITESDGELTEGQILFLKKKTHD